MGLIKKKKTKTKKSKSKNGFFKSVKHYATSDRVHFIIGLLICFFTIYIGIAMVSFFFTGSADQGAIKDLSSNELIAKKIHVMNWAGVNGAFIAYTIINNWFGIPSFFLLFVIGSIGVKMMKLMPINLLKRFLTCSIFTIWTSLFLAFTLSRLNDTLFFYPGGNHGRFLSEWLSNHIGNIGVILLLIASFLLIAIFINSKMIPMLRNLAATRQGEDAATRQGEAAATQQGEAATQQGEMGEDGEDWEMGEDLNTGEDWDTEERRGVLHTPNNGENTFTVEIATGEDEEDYDISSLGAYDPRLDLSHYKFPEISLLKKYDQLDKQVDMEEQNNNQKRIKKTLEDFGIQIVSIKATVGPAITLYEVVPDKGIRIARIRGLEDDIALSLSALGIRIIAPMPGKGTIGIEVPNKNPQIVSIESLIASRKFVESKLELPVALGRTITNEVFMFDLTKAPHLLVAGATGQGKSVGLNTIITSLLYKKHPAELKFVLVDPKMVEFNIYEGLERHYLAKMPDMDNAIITDFNKVIDTLKSLCKEMDNRYELLRKAHVVNVSEYNNKFINRHLNPEKGHQFMPYIVVVIDEFGDLIMTAGKEIEMPIARIAQKARAVGIHMIIATQRPSTNIITGTIKANFPARVGFKVSSMIDSRTILDSPGANKLVGRGDLLFSQGNDMIRVQCALIDTDEVIGIVKYISNQTGFATPYPLPEVLEEGQNGSDNAIDLNNRDPLFEETARLLVLKQQSSTSLIQRTFSIGYNRAGRLMDQLEAAGIVGPFDGNKGRQLLITDEYALEQKFKKLNG